MDGYVGWTLTAFALGAVDHQITQIITRGVIFEDFRAAVARRNEKLGYLLRCHLCAGTWLGFGIAFVATPNLLSPLSENAVVGWLLDAFLIACLGRVWNECLALLAAHVARAERS